MYSPLPCGLVLGIVARRGTKRKIALHLKLALAIRKSFFARKRPPFAKHELPEILSDAASFHWNSKQQHLPFAGGDTCDLRRQVSETAKYTICGVFHYGVATIMISGDL